MLYPKQLDKLVVRAFKHSSSNASINSQFSKELKAGEIWDNSNGSRWAVKNTAPIVAVAKLPSEPYKHLLVLDLGDIRGVEVELTLASRTTDLPRQNNYATAVVAVTDRDISTQLSQMDDRKKGFHTFSSLWTCTPPLHSFTASTSRPQATDSGSPLFSTIPIKSPLKLRNTSAWLRSSQTAMVLQSGEKAMFTIFATVSNPSFLHSSFGFLGLLMS
jgi:hypothetical protein